MGLSRKNQGLLLRLPFLLIILALVVCLLVLPGGGEHFSEAVANFPFLKYLYGANALNEFGGLGIFIDLAKSFLLVILRDVISKFIYLTTKLFSLVNVLGNEDATEKARNSILFRINEFLVEAIAWIVSVVILYYITAGINVAVKGAHVISGAVEFTVYVICLAGYIAYYIFVLQCTRKNAVMISVIDTLSEIVDIYLKGSLFILVFYAFYYNSDAAVLLLLLSFIFWLVLDASMEYIRKRLPATSDVKASIDYKVMIRALLTLICAYIAILIFEILLFPETYQLNETNKFIECFLRTQMPFVNCLLDGMSITKSIAADFWGFIPSFIKLIFLSMLMCISSKIFKVPNSIMCLKTSGRSGVKIVIDLIIAYYIITFSIALPLIVYLLLFILSIVSAKIVYFLFLVLVIVLAICFFTRPKARGLVIQSALIAIAFMIIVDVLSGIPGWLNYVTANPVALSITSLGLFVAIGFLQD